MLPRLHQGKHPDTDPRFWSEWKETAPPDLVVKKPRTFGWFVLHNFHNAVGVVLFLTFSALVIIGFCKTVRWMRS
jgi:hypothetical protein